MTRNDEQRSASRSKLVTAAEYGRFSPADVDHLSRVAALSFLLIGGPVSLLAYLNVFFLSFGSQVLFATAASLPFAIGYTMWARERIWRPVYVLELWFVLATTAMGLGGLLHALLVMILGYP